MHVVVAIVFVGSPTWELPGQEGLKPEESVREVDAVFPGAEPLDENLWREVWAVRIVDADTGLPIPEAVVRVPNHVAGAATPREILYLCTGKADEDGWVRLREKDMVGWRDYIVADAPGYAASAGVDYDGEVHALRRGTDVPVVVLDFTGRPVAGARIGLNLGCSHIPDQRTAVTDATGHAVLRSTCPWIDPLTRRVIAVHAPVRHRGWFQLSALWRPGSPPVAVHVPPGGAVVTGRLLKEDGTPWVGARVGPRGWYVPWAETDRGGRFRLLGVPAKAILDVFASRDDEEPETWFQPPPEGVERTLVRGEAGLVGGVMLEVRLRGPEGETAGGVTVAATRREDGYTSRKETGEDGLAEFLVPPGHYEIHADGELGTWSTASSLVKVDGGAAQPVAVEIQVPRNPTVRVDASRVQGLKVALATARQYRELDPAEIHGTEVPVPFGERAVFRVSGWEPQEYLVHFQEVPAEAGARGGEMVLEWLPPTEVRARLTGPDGAEVSGWLLVVRHVGMIFAYPEFLWHEAKEKGEPAPQPAARTRLAGPVDWVALAESEALLPAHGTVFLSAPGGNVDLGEVRLAAAPVPEGTPLLRVEFPPGVEQETLEMRLDIRRPGCPLRDELRTVLGRDGVVALHPARIAAGYILEITFPYDAFLPFTARIEGPPPWNVPWPRASLGLTIRDDRSLKPLPEAVVLVNGRRVPMKPGAAGTVLLRGFTAGVHEVIVAGRDHLARIHRLVFREGEHRALEVRLRRRE